MLQNIIWLILLALITLGPLLLAMIMMPGGFR